MVAQKALSLRLPHGQRFGVGHLVAVLRGEENDPQRRTRHDRLSVFGIGADSICTSGRQSSGSSRGRAATADDEGYGTCA